MSIFVNNKSVPGTINTTNKDEINRDDYHIQQMTVKNSPVVLLSPERNNFEDADENPEKKRLAIKWMQSSGLKMILDTDNLKELKAQWNAWSLLSHDQQILSDEKSLELFGVTNFQHYEEIYKRIMNHSKQYNKRIIDTGSGDRIFINNETSDIISLMKDNYQNKTSRIITTENKLIDRFRGINGFSYYSDKEVLEKGYYSNLIQIKEASKYRLNDSYTALDWIKNYILKCNGIISENDNEITVAWKHKLNDLFILKEQGQDVDEEIIKLGWNPSITLSESALIKAKERVLSTLDISETEIIDLSELTSTMKQVDINSLNESSIITKDGLKPLYLILVYAHTAIGNVINAFTKGRYSHAGISLDASLNTIYSFNIDRSEQGYSNGGFSIENLKRYISSSKDAETCVYAIFIPNKTYRIITDKIRSWKQNIMNTGYSILNLIGILLNKPIERDNKMVCSQFVDTILKLAQTPLTDKKSALVTPNDLKIGAEKKKVYKVYEGLAINYEKNVKKIERVIKSIRGSKYVLKENTTVISSEKEFLNELSSHYKDINSLILLDNSYRILSPANRTLYENYIHPMTSIQPVCEIKEFPVQFDKEGNLLISKRKSINFNMEFQKIHKLIMMYGKNNNIEGLKYELSALWFLNLLLVDKLYSKKLTEVERKDYVNARARILNDFTKYLNVVLKHDESFIFEEYYSNSPFSNATTKVNNSTLKYTGKIAKGLVNLLL